MTLLQLGAVAAGLSASTPSEGPTTCISRSRFDLLWEIAAMTTLVAASGGETLNAINLYIYGSCIII